MKKTLLALGVLACLTLPKLASAQNYPYAFSATTGQTYTPLSANATEIIGSVGWDDSVLAVTLPFDFNFWGTTAHDIYVDVNGGTDYEENIIPRILGFYSDYMDRGNSSVSIETTGTAPSRIAKVQFKNLGFYADTTSTLVDSANFQIWLYEGLGKIEYRAGASYTNDVVFDVEQNPIFAGLLYTTNVYTDLTATDTCHFVGYENNGPKDSVIVTVLYDNLFNPSFTFPNYGRFPANGTVFAFTPPAPNSIHDVKQGLNFSLYPNPAKESIVLSLPEMPAKNATFKIMDISGKVIRTQSITSKTTAINIAPLTAGFYYGSYNDDVHSGKTKFVKQ